MLPASVRPQGPSCGSIWPDIAQGAAICRPWGHQLLPLFTSSQLLPSCPNKQTNAKYATSKIETKTLKYNKAPYPCPFRIPEVTWPLFLLALELSGKSRPPSWAKFGRVVKFDMAAAGEWHHFMRMPIVLLPLKAWCIIMQSISTTSCFRGNIVRLMSWSFLGPQTGMDPW